MDSFTEDSANIEAIDNICFYCRNGEHVLLAERGVLARLSSIDALQSRSKAYLRYCAQRMTQAGSILKSAARKIVIDASNSKEGAIHLSSFSNSSYCEKSQLLTENPTDCQVISWLAEQLINERYKGYRMSIRPCNGGGSTLGQTLSLMLSAPSGPILCVADSDREFMTSAIGETAKSAQEALKKYNSNYPAELKVINERELENILPGDVRAQCVAKYMPALTGMVDLLERTDAAFSDYFCLKKGDSMCRIFQSIESKGRTDLLQHHIERKRSPLPSTASCGHHDHPEPCRSGPAFGKGFLALVAREATAGRLRTEVAAWRQELRDLVQHAAEYGLASEPVRV